MKLDNKQLTLEHLEIIRERIEEMTKLFKDQPELKILGIHLESDSIHGCELLNLETNRGTFYCGFPAFNNYEFYVGLSGLY